MSIDWARLYSEGRCKNYGIPWSDEENAAVFILGIPADYVRRGCLTKEAYEKMLSEDEAEVKNTGTIPLTQCKKERLEKLCAEYGVSFTPEATRNVLIEELRLKGCPTRVDA